MGSAQSKVGSDNLRLISSVHIPGFQPRTQLLPPFLVSSRWNDITGAVWAHKQSFFTLSPFADALCLLVYTLLWQIWLGVPAGAPGRSENGELSRATGQSLDGLAGGIPSQPGRYAGGGDGDSAGPRGPGGYRAPGYGESGLVPHPQRQLQAQHTQLFYIRTR